MKDFIFTNILCPIDIDDPPVKSMGFVRRLLGTQSDLNINFLYINQFIPLVQYPQQSFQHVFDGSIAPDQLKDKNILLNDLIAKYFTSPMNFSSHVDSGNIANMINHYAATLHVDLIVLETHTRAALLDLIEPSIPQKVLRQSSCPVMIVK